MGCLISGLSEWDICIFPLFLEREKKSWVVAIVLGLWVMCVSLETMEGKLSSQLVIGKAGTILTECAFLCCAVYGCN